MGILSCSSYLLDILHRTVYTYCIAIDRQEYRKIGQSKTSDIIMWLQIKYSLGKVFTFVF